MDGDYVDRETGEILSVPMAATHRWSQPCDALFAAMALAQAGVENIEKGGTNPAFRSRYTTLGDAMAEVRPKFAAQGIAITQMPINGAGPNIGVVTLFAHKSGQWLESTLFVAPTKFDAQGAGSAITYLRRYALMAMAGVAPDDDDGNAAVGRPSETATGARITHEAGRAATAARARSQAAPAPSAAKEEATKLYRELRDAIDSATNIATLDAWSGSPAWKRCAELIGESEGDPAKAVNAMQLLRDRIAGQRQYLLGSTP